MANIQVLKNNLSSAFEIQQCTVGSFSLIERIPGFQCVFASYVSIECSERNSENSRFRILNRLSRGRTIVDGVPVLNCSFRVMELIVSPEFSYGDDYQTRFELTLAKEINRMRPGINELFGQKRDLITSIDRIRLLKSGPIKLIRITVITSTYPPASCSRYPSTSRDRNDDENNSSYFNIFSEIIKTILQTYDIRLKTRVLIDLRDCSLAKSFYCEEERSEILSPEFIFVDECQMKHSTNSDRNNLTEIGIGRVNSQTQILIKRVHHVDYYSRLLQSLKQDNSPFHFAGVERVFEKLKEIVEIQMCSKRENLCGSVKVSQGLLVAGPQGSGKSRAICEAAKVLQANLLVFKVATSKIPIVSNNDNSRQRTTSYFSRMNSLNEIFSKAIASGNMYPTILLIEGLELLHYNRQSDMTAGKKQKNQSSVQKEKLVNNICHLFDFVPSDCLLTIVATTSKPHLTPTHLRIFPRLQQEITINIPVESVRVKILKSLTNGNHAFEAIDLNSIAKRTPGFVGADLMRLVHRTFQKMRDEECNSVSELHIKYALAHVFPSALQGSIGLVDIQRVTSLDHIVGLEQVKLNLIKAIVWPLLFPHAFFTMGIQPSKGILLYGPPGCGKTTLVRALAASHQTNFLSVSAAELFSSGVGDSEKIVSHLFHRARMASPCILFLDELDSIVGARDSNSRKTNSVNNTILSMMLTEMDGVGIRTDTTATNYIENGEEEIYSPRVIVVGATNRPELIDSALLRPGRFDRIVAVPPPDESGRLEFLRKSAEKTPMNEDVDLEKLARETEGYSCSDLGKLVREAVLFALAEDINRSSVSMEHYIKAKAELPPSLSLENLRSFYEYSSSPDSSAIHHLTNKINSIRL